MTLFLIFLFYFSSWKVFQCLLIGGENSGEDALRNAESYVITEEEFQTFLQRHKDVKCLVPESNEKVIIVTVKASSKRKRSL